jgi:hypothetical protein
MGSDTLLVQLLVYIVKCEANGEVIFVAQLTTFALQSYKNWRYPLTHLKLQQCLYESHLPL